MLGKQLMPESWGEISLEMYFDAGHRIVGHKGKCARLHGHTYRLHIQAIGVVREPGFVADFGDIKEIVNRWDHRMLLWTDDPLFRCNLALPDGTTLAHLDEGIVPLPFNPTAENMVRFLAHTLKDELELGGVFLELWETKNAMARCQVD